jgi:hypothetical protein
MKRLTVMLMLLILVTLIVTACDGVVPVTLTKVTTTTASRGADDSADWATLFPFPIPCTYSHGLGALDNPPGGVIRVGHDYLSDEGTAPFNCWYYVNHVYRGHVKFDLNALRGKKVVSVVMEWTEEGVETDFGHVWSGPDVTCMDEVRAAASPWTWDEPSIMAWTAPPNRIDVTTVVQGWVANPSTNHGFYFVGDDESMPGRGFNNSCLSLLSNFKLSVVVGR